MNRISRYRSALMGFAALWVYYFHIGLIPESSNPVVSETAWFLHRIGFCGVDIFMVLSAFGLSHSFQKKPVTGPVTYMKYLVRRL